MLFNENCQKTSQTVTHNKMWNNCNLYICQRIDSVWQLLSVFMTLN